MSTVKKFQKVKEDFTCQACGITVKGTGYTNHCPECLVSKHVDIFPGDRLEDCGGLMDVVEVTKSGDKYLLTHKCRSCGGTNTDHFRAGADNFDTLIKLSKPNQLGGRTSK